MKFCGNCGTQLADDARFCGNCGAACHTSEEPLKSMEINENSEGIKQTDAAAEENTIKTETVSEIQPETEPLEKVFKPWPIIGLSAGVLAFALIAVGFGIPSIALAITGLVFSVMGKKPYFKLRGLAVAGVPVCIVAIVICAIYGPIIGCASCSAIAGTSLDTTSAYETTAKAENLNTSEVRIKHCTIEIPEYWDKDSLDSTETNKVYYAEKYSNTAKLSLRYYYDTEDAVTYDNLLYFKDEMISTWESTYTNCVVDTCDEYTTSSGVSGLLFYYEFEMKEFLDSEDAFGYLFCFPSEIDGSWIYVEMQISDGADDHSYAGDYTAMLDTLTKVEAPETEAPETTKVPETTKAPETVKVPETTKAPETNVPSSNNSTTLRNREYTITSVERYTDYSWLTEPADGNMVIKVVLQCTNNSSVTQTLNWLYLDIIDEDVDEYIWGEDWATSTIKPGETGTLNCFFEVPETKESFSFTYSPDLFYDDEITFTIKCK